MAKDAELDRLKAAQDRAFQRKQNAYRAQQHAWEARSAARDVMNRAYEAKQRAYADQDGHGGTTNPYEAPMVRALIRSMRSRNGRIRI